MARGSGSTPGHDDSSHDDSSHDDPAPARTGAVLAAEFRRIHAGSRWQELTDGERAEVQAQNASPDAAEQAAALAAYYKSVHALPAGRRQTALCLSGGGIRSAAFCMGIIQGLARRRLLGQFHYLSTVSGGGYIGSWLVAWAHRFCRADPARSFAVFEDLVARRPPWAIAERKPIEWLRGHQRFLNPDSSLTSPDTWAPIAIVIRDLLLNWLVFVPLILAALLVPRILEFGLIAWGYTGTGSVFGALFTHIGALIWTGVDAQPLPGWRDWTGWCDAAGAALILVAMVAAARNRLAGTSSGMDDAGFVRRVLLFLVGGAALLTMFIAVLAVRAPDVDTVLLAEWSCGIALTLLLARVVARCLPRGAAPLRPLRTFVLECLALALSGAVTGLAIWVLLKLRAQAGMTAQLGVRDLVSCGIPLLLVAYVLGQVVYSGLTSRSVFGRADQEWLARASGFCLILAVLWAVASSLVLFSQELFAHTWALVIGLVSGTVTLASATSTFSLATSALKASRIQLSVTRLATLACLVFLASGTVVLSHATARLLDRPDWGGNLEYGTALGRMALDRAAQIDSQRPTLPDDLDRAATSRMPGREFDAFVAAGAFRLMGLASLVSIALAGISACASFFVDVNLFSLHALYRNRLVRSFLGASNLTGARNRFDNFSGSDDIPMPDLWSEGGTERNGPFPVVNMAINLAPSADLARQQRQASSFIATPLHMGGDAVDYLPHTPGSEDPITLGTAMAISGAAFNANWGYHTSPLVRFVMMLFNVRLGWWARNPRVPGRGRGWSSLSLLVQETFGLLATTRSHVYLSDGGHFDNLGLYEMLRRRCHTIVVIDASQDFDMTLQDLGRSLRNAAADMGITVDFGELGMVKRTDPPAPGIYCAVGVITYPEYVGPEADRARLIYVKPGFYKDSPADVRAYAASNARFPHDTTANQWFTESQFESYRTLGSHVMTAMFGPARKLALAELPARAEQYMKRATGPKPDTRPA